MPEFFTSPIAPADLPDNADPRLKKIARLIFEIGDANEKTGDSSHKAGIRWTNWARALALLSGVLAAVSGVLGLASENDTLAAGIALASAVVVAVTVALRPFDAAAEHHAFSDACWRVTGEAVDILLAFEDDMSLAEARASLTELRSHSHDVARRRPAARAEIV